MGNAQKKDSYINRNSNASVFEMSIDTKKSLKEHNSPDTDFDFKEELRNAIDLPIENEINEYEEIPLDDNAEEIKNYIFSYGEAPPVSGPFPHQFRSKSYVPMQNISLFNAPKPQIKEFNVHISPFKLNTKCFGGSQRKNKMPNDIILNFQKNRIDNKSCNDNLNEEDYFYDDELGSDINTERSTPNIEDLKNLQNCRKKMAIFRDSIGNKSDLSVNENDKMDYIFSDYKNKNKHNKFWTKYIKQQKIESKISNKFRLSHATSLKKAGTLKPHNKLFILGILESASKDIKTKTKMRNTAYC